MSREGSPCKRMAKLCSLSALCTSTAAPSRASSSSSHSFSRTSAVTSPTNTPARTSSSQRVSSPRSDTGTRSNTNTTIASPSSRRLLGGAVSTLRRVFDRPRRSLGALGAAIWRLVLVAPVHPARHLARLRVPQPARHRFVRVEGRLLALIDLQRTVDVRQDPLQQPRRLERIAARLADRRLHAARGGG